MNARRKSSVVDLPRIGTCVRAGPASVELRETVGASAHDQVSKCIGEGMQSRKEPSIGKV